MADVGDAGFRSLVEVHELFLGRDIDALRVLGHTPIEQRLGEGIAGAGVRVLGVG